MATSTTAQYAAGEAAVVVQGVSADSGTAKALGLSKKRVTVSTESFKPLFAAECDYRASKLFTRARKGMLCLYGTDLQVIDVTGMDNGSADASSSSTPGGADATSHFVLRWVNYINLLDVSFVGPTTLKIQHGDTSDKPRVTPAAPGDAYSADDLVASPTSHGGSSSAGSAAGASGASTSIRVTCDSFSLTFRDAGIAQRAAAALLFQQAQYAAMRHWLRTGLHAGFRCDLVAVCALPLLFDNSQQRGSSGLGSRSLARSHSVLPPHVLYSCSLGAFPPRNSMAGSGAGAGPAAAGAAAAGAAAAVPYPWGDADSQDWGCSLPLPAGWGPVLDAAASSSGQRDDAPATPEELTSPIALQSGPKALQVTISTPLGAAVATITPQLAKAALLHSSCREILALPLHRAAGGGSSSSSPSAASAAAFAWTVQGSVAAAPGVAAGAEASTGSSSSVSVAGLDPDDVPSVFAGAAGGSHSAGGLSLEHSLDAFALLVVEVVRSPGTANTRGMGRVFEAAAPAAAASPSAQQAAETAAAGDAASSSSSSSDGLSSVGVQLQLAVCAVLAAVAVQQFRVQPLLLLLELLLLAAVAATAWTSQQSSSSSSGSSTSGSSTAKPGVQKVLPAASSNSSTEDVTCCGWSVVLLSADLCSSPSRHLQLQVSLARASRGMARLRLRMASMSTGGAAQLPLIGGPSDEEEEDGSSMPVLVSDPEPAWLDPDTKQRFINAKPTLEASREQAIRTNKWRQQMQVDTVMTRPCPKFPLMCRLLPTYLLSDDTPEGHAVVLMKIGGVKDLCDAIFETPDGSPDGLSLLEAEHTLALLNEFLVHKAAPKPLPAGFQVQIYDLAGFKLSFATGNMVTLFKLLVKFGLWYPERLHLALVINAPAWFSTPFRAMSALLDENTSAKVVVVGNPKAALSTLTHHLGGIDNVPVAWGGRCSLPFEDYPANRRMMQFGQQLNSS